MFFFYLYNYYVLVCLTEPLVKSNLFYLTPIVHLFSDASIQPFNFVIYERFQKSRAFKGDRVLANCSQRSFSRKLFEMMKMMFKVLFIQYHSPVFCFIQVTEAGGKGKFIFSPQMNKQRKQGVEFLNNKQNSRRCVGSFLHSFAFT